MTTSLDLTVLASALPRIWPRQVGADVQLSPVSGGFSGAKVFRVTSSASASTYALRAWPIGYRDFDRLRSLHQFLAALHNAGFPVAVPIPVEESGLTVMRGGDRIWQLEPWLPGAPLTIGCEVDVVRPVMRRLAQMHLTCERYQPDGDDDPLIARTAPSPSIEERIAFLNRWSTDRLARLETATIKSQEGLLILPPDDAAEVCGPIERVPALQARMLYQFLYQGPVIQRKLEALREQSFRLHPCWRDLWHAHVLLSDGDVTGLLDAAATRTDHVATDLSRLLGSLWGNDWSRWDAALAEYATIRPLSDQEHRLIRVLDHSNVLLSGMTWLARSYDTPHRLGVAELDRWAGIITRLEHLA
ncbi:MAG: phosphotransferase [Planctomycetaceae bacterium]|nr:phosphotransferase [Planctomycetaceae bacterium]